MEVLKTFCLGFIALSFIIGIRVAIIYFLGFEAIMIVLIILAIIFISIGLGLILRGVE